MKQVINVINAFSKNISYSTKNDKQNSQTEWAKQEWETWKQEKNDESCNYGRNKRSTRESDQETEKIRTEAKILLSSVCIILRSK